MPRSIGLSHRLFGAAFAGEQDAQRQKGDADIKPQRGMANIPVASIRWSKSLNKPPIALA
jgi:hypothetical protein